MSKVEYIADRTDIELTPVQLLARAAGAKLQSAMVLGITEDGDMYFETAALADIDATWLMANFQHHIMLRANE